jgi:hypothetical protein
VSLIASLEFAGLEIQFESADPRALELVRVAATVSPAVIAGQNRHPFAVRARLSEGPAPSWVPEGRSGAVAESPLDEDSFVAVLRAAMCQALAPEGALLHAAGVVLDDQGVLLIAPSEGGKTTISRLLSTEADILSDETICVRPDADRQGHYTLYGSCFWSGPAYPSRAGGFPLRAICFLRKGALALSPLPKTQALRELLAELHLPIGPTAVADSVAFADRLVSSASLHTLSFSLDSKPALMLRELLARGPR